MILAPHIVKYKYQYVRWMLMKKLVIEFSNERLITPSGLSLVGQMLGKSNFIKKYNNMKVDGKHSQSQIKNGDILLSWECKIKHVSYFCFITYTLYFTLPILSSSCKKTTEFHGFRVY